MRNPGDPHNLIQTDQSGVKAPRKEMFATTEEWTDWIGSKEALTLKIYRDDPDRMLAEYGQEKSIARDYQGRELLELLQNANDAAAEADTMSRIFIELSEHGLIVANTGNPFSPAGLSSLRLAHLSPKVETKGRFIGQKGLGFRAVLNWSKHPCILSGAMNIAYTEWKLDVTFAALKSGSPAVAKRLESYPLHPDEIPLPMLPFPTWVKHDGATIADFQGSQRQIIERCMEIRYEYDTVIGLPFDTRETLQHAEEELERLKPEFLLFTQNIGELMIHRLGLEVEKWRRETHDYGHQVLITEGTKQQRTEWKIHQVQSKIPLEYRSEPDVANFEIVIAEPVNDTICTPRELFSFFPTDVRFPFPVLCHATVELDGSRKRLREGQPNRFIVEKVAELLVDISDSRSDPLDPWIKVKTLAWQGSMDQLLERLGLKQTLLLAAQTRPLICSYGRSFLRPADSKRLNIDEIDWLPTATFADLSLPPPDINIQEFLDELGIPLLDSDALRERINAIQFESLNERAKIVAGLIRNKLLPTNPVPKLLVDDKRIVVEPGRRTFMPPEGSVRYDLPEWISVRFLDPTLCDLLSSLLGTTSRRSLTSQLAPFSVQEYAVLPIVNAILNETKSLMNREPESRQHYNQDMITALYLLFVSIPEPPTLAEWVSAPLPNCDGSYSDSRTLYFGEYFTEESSNGQLLASLYATRPLLLLAPMDAIGLPGDNSDTIRFFNWLGVSSMPREKSLTYAEHQFLKFVLDSLPYPILIGSDRKYRYENASEFSEPTIGSIRSIDNLDSILEASPAAILTWLAKDLRVNSWRRPDPSNAELTERRYNDKSRRAYNGPIPNYAMWKIKSTPWLPVQGGDKSTPNSCMIGERGLESICPLPAIDPSDPLFTHFGIDRRQLRNALENAGVLTDISYLDPEQIYDLMNRLAELNADSSVARSLYRTVLEKIDLDRVQWPHDLPIAWKTARMWGRGSAGDKYYHVNELRHVDNEGVPEKLLSRLNVVDLPKRVGALRVRRIFGIESVDKKSYSLSVRRAVEVQGSQDINLQFQRVKPYLLGLRGVRSKQTADKRQLRDLEIRLCSTIEVSINYDDMNLNDELDAQYQWVLDDNIAYVLYSSDEHPSLDNDLLTTALGDVTASIFNLAQGGDFARLIGASEAHRLPLLTHMIGEAEAPNIQLLMMELGDVRTEADIYLPPSSYQDGVAGPPETSVVASTIGQPKENLVSRFQDSGGIQNNLPDGGSRSIRGVGVVTFTREKHVPSPRPTKREVIVRGAVSKAKASVSKGLSRVDGFVCEEWVRQFEKLDGRVVLLVRDTLGYAGPRCDILSFANEESRDKFVSLPASAKRDLSLVDRFIEVKGRSDEVTPISLKGNELQAADAHGAKYFMYRMYQKSDREFLLLILQNPLNHREAVDKVMDVYVSRAEDVDCCHLTIIDQEQTDREATNSPSS